ATARALAASRTQNAISLDELKRALQVARSARESEQRLAANLGRAARPGGNADPLQRLATVPMPPEPPFVQATARYLTAHPGQDRQLGAGLGRSAQAALAPRAAARDWAAAGRPDRLPLPRAAHMRGRSLRGHGGLSVRFAGPVDAQRGGEALTHLALRQLWKS